jgi:ABC-type nickel/cobalt efflux system permease component RcnA
MRRTSAAGLSVSMDFLLYFNSAAMVLVLFVGAAAIAAWSVKKFWRVTLRLFSRAEDKPGKKRPAARTKDQWDPSHPHHYKRAGQ